MEFISWILKVTLQKHIFLKIPNITLLFKLIKIDFKHVRRTWKEVKMVFTEDEKISQQKHAAQDWTTLIVYTAKELGKWIKTLTNTNPFLFCPFPFFFFFSKYKNVVYL